MDKEPISDYIKEVYPVLERILYNIAAYKTIQSFISKDDSLIENPYEQEFWVEMLNNAIQMAIIDWCKIFGSERDNPYHYKKHLENEINGIGQIKEPMILFRNKFAVHWTNKKVPVPYLDGARELIYAFDQVIRGKYDLDGYPELQNIYECYQLRVEDVCEGYGLYKQDRDSE